MANSSDDAVYVTVVGTNNLRRDHTDDIVRKYRSMIRSFSERRRKVAVCGILPRYDNAADIQLYRKMSIINRKLVQLCVDEGSHYLDVWEHFCSDRSLFSRDGLHLNSVGKARLGRVLDQKVREITKRKTQPNLVHVSEASCQTDNPSQVHSDPSSTVNPSQVHSGQTSTENPSQVPSVQASTGNPPQVPSGQASSDNPLPVSQATASQVSTGDQVIAQTGDNNPGVSTAGNFL